MTSAGMGLHVHVSPMEVALTRTFVVASSDSMIDSCQGIAAQLHVRGAPPEVLDQALRAVEVAVEHDHALEAVGDEPVDDGARPAARAQHDGLARHLLLPTSRSSATLNPGTSVLCPIRRLPSRVIVLTAPVAWAVVYGLITEGFQRIVIFNRHLHRAEGLVKHFGRSAAHMELRAMPWHESIIESELAKTKVLVNATSIGLTSDVSPIPAEVLNNELLVLDLIYARTRLLRDAESAGATTAVGELMLLHQGAAAFTLWTGQAAPLDLMQAKLAEARAGGLRSAEGEPAGDATEPAAAAAESTAFRFLTAGESHGPALGAAIEGVPAGLPLSEGVIAIDLARRQKATAVGRVRRSSRTEPRVARRRPPRPDPRLADPALIRNRDWENWTRVMQVGR